MARPDRARRRHRCDQPSRVLPDGRFIAVATNDRRGLRIVDTRAQHVTTVDTDYSDAIEWVDFASDGRLVTSSLDGTVRLYDPTFKRVAT